MNYEIVLQSEAVDDIQNVFDWYEHQRSGLGYEFINEMEDLKVIINSVRRISQEPKR